MDMDYPFGGIRVPEPRTVLHMIKPDTDYKVSNIDPAHDVIFFMDAYRTKVERGVCGYHAFSHASGSDRDPCFVHQRLKLKRSFFSYNAVACQDSRCRGFLN